MKKFALSSLVCAALAAGSISAHASGLGDALRGQLGGSAAESSAGSSGLGGMLGAGAGGAGGSSALSALGLGGLASSGTASNAAGVITYCMKNNYLNANKAAQVKDQLLGKLGLGQKEEPKDQATRMACWAWSPARTVKASAWTRSRATSRKKPATSCWTMPSRCSDLKA